MEGGGVGKGGGERRGGLLWEEIGRCFSEMMRDRLEGENNQFRRPD